MMISKRVVGPSLLLIGLSLCGCASTAGSGVAPAHDNMDAVVWLQTSTEYAAVTTGIYAAATAALREIAEANPDRTNSMAIVMDIDETVLDNSRYQGQLVRDDASYESDTWDRWLALRAADAVPGVVEFIRSSQLLGFHVAFITNRRCRARPGTPGDCPQMQDTLVNLEALGVSTESTTLYLRGDRPSERCLALLSDSEQADGTWSGDKTSRRDCVGLDYDIVMLFGDQLGDFTEGHDGQSAKSGRARAAEYGEFWGRTWFMLPNPTYGSWRPREHAGKRALIRGVD